MQIYAVSELDQLTTDYNINYSTQYVIGSNNINDASDKIKNIYGEHSYIEVSKLVDSQKYCSKKINLASILCDIYTKLFDLQIQLNATNGLSSNIKQNTDNIDFLSGQHDWLSTELSNSLKQEIEISRENETTNTNNINFLSGQHGWLSTQLSNRLNYENSRAKNAEQYLSGEIDKLDDQISYLDGDIINIQDKYLKLNSDSTQTVRGNVIFTNKIDGSILSADYATNAGNAYQAKWS